MFYSEYRSPVGTLTIAADEDSIVGLWLEGQRYFMEGYEKAAFKRENTTVILAAHEWLDAYFLGKNPSLSALSLAPCGSEFRQLVWQILTEIPYGTTVTYGDVAKTAALRMGKTQMSAQAAGGAVGHNPISIIIPCHRVVGSGSKLTGYSGGIDRKLQLLRLEGAEVAAITPVNL